MKHSNKIIIIKPYTNSLNTDIRKTFKKQREQIKEASKKIVSISNKKHKTA